MPGHKWQKPNMGDLLEKPKIRKVYMKANLIVHPDKVKQRNGPVEEMVASNMIFDILKSAWNNAT